MEVTSLRSVMIHAFCIVDVPLKAHAAVVEAVAATLAYVVLSHFGVFPFVIDLIFTLRWLEANHLLPDALAVTGILSCRPVGLLR